jgi:hypothetical protein
MLKTRIGRALLAASIALALAAGTGTPALAASGSYTASGGESCSWFGDTMMTVSCSGYNRRAGGFVSYNCTIYRWSSGSSWNCRSSDGATWSGSN